MRLINTADVPNWMNEYDSQRISSYLLYENIYWTNPNTFKLQQRGTEENPIYIPSGRVIVNTMDRYTAPEWMPVMNSKFGTANEQAEALLLVQDLFARERMGSQFQSNKLYGIMRGDWCFYITGNPRKAQGTRLKIQAIDPAMFFPIEDPDDPDKILGQDLVEQIRVGDDLRIKRTRYLKSEHPDHPGGGETVGGPISFQVDVMEIEGWESEKPKFVNSDQVQPPVLLPSQITALPVYHVKNFDEPQNPFGSSEMRGIERVMAAVNQSITDEELTLALHGLGMYKSAKGQPRDTNGNPTPWQLGPGKVVHDETFDRVTGVNTVTPFQDHLQYLHSQMDQVTGASDVAKGVVDVTVAESGIALALRMGPILGAARKKDTLIVEVMDQMLFDLRNWMAGYESANLENVRFNSKLGQKIPPDNEKRFQELMAMYSADPPLITAAYFRDACREMGMDIPADVTGLAIAEERAAMAAVMDPFGARAEEEIAANQQVPDAADAAAAEE